MHIFHHLLCYILNIVISFFLRKKTVLVITGLRRSGNHACINWLANALENESVQLRARDKNRYNLFQSESGLTLHFNEVNYMHRTDALSLFRFLSRIYRKRNDIKKASNFIITFEDFIPTKHDLFVPRNAKKIAIRRSVLNIVASRLKRAITQAKIGLDRGDMSIDNNFVSYLYWLQNKCLDQDWLIWDFELWVSDKEYRSSFLKKLNLISDILPEISIQGGGSSFSGKNTIPSKSELQNRWHNIEFAHRILELISELPSPSILTSTEKKFIEAQLRSLPKKAIKSE